MIQLWCMSLLVATAILSISPVTRSQSEFFGRGQSGSCLFGTVEKTYQSRAFGVLFGATPNGIIDLNVQAAFVSSSGEDFTSGAFGVEIGATTGSRANPLKQSFALSFGSGCALVPANTASGSSSVVFSCGLELLVRPSASLHTQLIPRVGVGIAVPSSGSGLENSTVVSAGIPLYIPTSERGRLVIMPNVSGDKDVFAVGLSIGMVSITGGGRK